MPKISYTFDRYEQLLERVSTESIHVWSAIESDFIDATSAFDSEYMQGEQGTGWYQIKARYFNDLIVALLSNASGKVMATRTKKSSRLFSNLDIDVCYPSDGVPVVGAEVKMLGTPPHPGNNMAPRNARSDLHKRVREVAFTAIDFKVAYAPPRPIGSFQDWIDSSKPGYFTFWAMRVQDERDFEAVRTILVKLRSYCNGVGAIIYRGESEEHPTRYLVRKVAELDIDQNIHEMAQRIA